MEETGVFNRLASELPMDDRKGLLEKLSAQSVASHQPLYDDPGNQDTAIVREMKVQYETLPWYSRFFFWIVSLFKGKAPLQVFEDQQVALLGRQIEEQFPGLYDYEHDQLLPDFYNETSVLKESVHFFYDALDLSVNRDKGAFYVFLASLEIEDIHRRLLDETDPKKIAEQYPEASESMRRQIGLQALDEGITAIGDDRRAVMYYNARTLHCLKELSSFLFDRLLVSFAFHASRQGKVCSAHLVNNYLRNLNNILYSMKETPSMTLLESLFIFILQDKAEESGFNLENEMTVLLSRAENALRVIRNFNKTVPLTRILRCAERDMSITPKGVSGGEDWFSMYKEYWKQSVEERFSDYIRNHRRRDLLEAFKVFFNGTELRVLAGAESELNPVGIPLKGAFCLSFLLTFYSVVFLHELNLILRPILIDGEFFKKENLTEFTESYNALFKLEETITCFEDEISLTGDLGKRYTAATMDLSSLSVKKHKVQLVVDEASEEAKRIIGQVRDAMALIIKVLNGILVRSPDGKFDTLTNLADMSIGEIRQNSPGGTSGAEVSPQTPRSEVEKTDAFTGGVNAAIQKLTKALQLMDDIDAMEAGRC
jgi:hypothetical protein